MQRSGGNGGNGENVSFIDKIKKAIMPNSDKKYNQPKKTNKVVIPSYLSPLIGFLRGLAIFIISLSIVSGTIYYGIKKIDQKYIAPVDEKDDSTILFIVESGDSLTKISANLVDAGLVRNKGVFKYYVDFTDRTKDLKAGAYHLNRTMTMDEIIEQLMIGSEMDNTMNITVTEGSTLESMAEQIKTQMEENYLTFDTEEFLTLCNSGESFSADYTFIQSLIEDPTSEDRKYLLEGYLFPDTYQIYLTATPEDVIRRMLDRTEEILALDEISANMEITGYTVDDLLTLASVVEKEGTTDSFSKVAAVFTNRIKQNMKLQSDVTVQYALGISNLSLSNGEINTDSPYNTYMYSGLPLGPICAPSKNAIMAVLVPEPTYISAGYLFFTLTDPNTGELVFSTTAEQHEAVVSQWSDTWKQYDQEHSGN